MTVLARLVAAIALLAFVTPADVFACATCFGAAGSGQVEGMNGAIIGLLVFTVGMMAAFGSFFLYLKRRAHLHASSPSNPHHAHLDRTANQEDIQQ